MSSFDKDSERAFVRHILVKIKHLTAARYMFEMKNVRICAMANYTELFKNRELLGFRIYFL